MAQISHPDATPSRWLPSLIFGAVLVGLSVVSWLWLVEHRTWPVVQQFWGHLAPSAFLVALGAAAFFLRDNIITMLRAEAWLAVITGGLYIPIDTFVMHPPWGIFDGAGLAEEEHVSIMFMIFALGLSGLVLLRNLRALKGVPSVHFVIGATIAAIVLLGHHQHTHAGGAIHNAVIILLAISALFRVLGKILEYGIALTVTGFVLYSSQTGFAHYVEVSKMSAGAWIAAWAAAGFLAATGFLLLSGARLDQDDA